MWLQNYRAGCHVAALWSFIFAEKESVGNPGGC